MIFLLLYITAIALPNTDCDEKKKELFHRKYDQVFYCPVYSDVLPKGFCMEHLNNSEVAIYSTQLRKTDKDYRFFSNLLNFYEDLSMVELYDKLKFFTSIYLDECGLNDTVIERYLKNIPLLTTTDMIKCINSSKWFFCHMFIPRCELNKTSATFKYKPMCRESCLKHTESDVCIRTYEFILNLFKLGNVCSKQFGNIEQFNCSFYPSYSENPNGCHRDIQNNDFQLDDSNKIEIEQENTPKKIDAAFIAGICVGVVFVIFIVAIVTISLVRHKRKHSSNDDVDVTATFSPYSTAPVRHEDIKDFIKSDQINE